MPRPAHAPSGAGEGSASARVLMDERAVAVEIPAKHSRAMLLVSGSRRFPIVSLQPDGCLIEAPPGVGPRGFADILDGERLVATCLVVLAAPEGPYLRCTFKRRTASRTEAPADFATDVATDFATAPASDRRWISPADRPRRNPDANPVERTGV